MPQPTALDIEKLCDNWCSASTAPNGGINIGDKTERYRLLANSVCFHELNHEVLCAALIGLSKVLLRPGLSTVVDHDHYALWSWCGEILLGIRSTLFSQQQYEIKSLYETTIHAALANCRKPPSTRDEWSEQNRILELQPHHAKQLLQQSGLVLTYLGFPLLEAVLKRSCATYVAFDGKVLSPFEVPNKWGGTRKYKLNGQCSSLRDLLFLHSIVVASPELKALIDRFRIHLNSLDVIQDPFDLLFSWRNQSLHGEANLQTIGGTVLNFSLLISLFEIKDCFDKHRLQALDNCRWEARLQAKSRAPLSFYPPY